jgi:hypothetical protein
MWIYCSFVLALGITRPCPEYLAYNVPFFPSHPLCVYIDFPPLSNPVPMASVVTDRIREL